jgi:hypothetical protein
MRGNKSRGSPFGANIKHQMSLFPIISRHVTVILPVLELLTMQIFLEI